MADVDQHASFLGSATCEVGGTEGEKAAAEIDHISAAELTELLGRRADEDNVVILDVRESKELAGPLGNIDGARHVPLPKLAESLGELEAHRPDTLVTVCRSGVRSDSAAARLRAAGFENVFSLTGGMKAWREFSGSRR